MINFRPHGPPWAALVLLTAATASAQDPRAESFGKDSLDYCKVRIIDEVFVPAEEAGVLDELNVQEGMEVEKGMLLGTVDDTDARLALEMAMYEYLAAKKQAENTLSVDAAEKSQEVAQAEYEASVEANERVKGTVTETEVRRKRLQSQRAGMQIKLAEHELEVAALDQQVKLKQFKRAEAAVKRRQIVARINGIVVELNKHAGDWVQPGETVMRIVRMDQLRVQGEIDGTYYARHEVIGRPVDIEVRLTGGGLEGLEGLERMEGTITYASPIIESKHYTVRAVVDNRKINGRWLLTPGLDAEMRLREPGIGRRGGTEQR